jgi:glutathione S-transferase
MKLFYSPFHSFVHKVLVAADESGLWGRITFVPTFPSKNREGVFQGDAYGIGKINPLGKVPTLALEDGRVIYGSQAVAEFFDANGDSKQRLFPQAPPARWETLARLALADTMFESTTMLVREGWNPAEEQRLPLFEWIWPKLIRGMDRFEEYCSMGFSGFDMGQASMLQAISYLDFRAKFYASADLLHPDFDCFQGRPHLQAWWDETIQRSSVQRHYQVDYTGDDSPENCQRHIAEVLAVQKSRNTL